MGYKEYRAAKEALDGSLFGGNSRKVFDNDGRIPFEVHCDLPLGGSFFYAAFGY